MFRLVLLALAPGVLPDHLPTKDWFSYYAANFRTVELNAPFYSWPTDNTVKAWLRQADSKDYVYTVKVSELTTRVKRFRRTQTLVKDFGFIADLLGKRMGCFFVSIAAELPVHRTPFESHLRAA